MDKYLKGLGPNTRTSYRVLLRTPPLDIVN